MLISGAASKPTSNKPAQQSSASGLVGGDSEVGVSSVLNCSLVSHALDCVLFISAM